MSKKILLPGEKRQTEIVIQTRKGTDISNVQEYEMTPALLYITEGLKKNYQEPYVSFVNGVSPIYNCHGLTFGSRRAMIYDPPEIIKILNEDDYVEIKDMDDVHEGDIIIYYDGNGDVEHSGVVIGNRLKLPLILSKWGPGPEAIHVYSQCPYNPSNVKFYRISK